MSPPAGDTRAADEAVEIRIPARSRYLAVARLAAAGLISDADPDVEVVENLQLAVNEVLVLLVEASHDEASLEVELWTSGELILVRACSTQLVEDVLADPDPLTVRVLAATTQSWRFDPDGSANLVVPAGRG